MEGAGVGRRTLASFWSSSRASRCAVCTDSRQNPYRCQEWPRQYEAAIPGTDPEESRGDLPPRGVIATDGGPNARRTGCSREGFQSRPACLFRPAPRPPPPSRFGGRVLDLPPPVSEKVSSRPFLLEVDRPRVARKSASTSALDSDEFRGHGRDLFASRSTWGRSGSPRRHRRSGHGFGRVPVPRARVFVKMPTWEVPRTSQVGFLTKDRICVEPEPEAQAPISAQLCEQPSVRNLGRPLATPPDRPPQKAPSRAESQIVPRGRHRAVEECRGSPGLWLDRLRPRQALGGGQHEARGPEEHGQHRSRWGVRAAGRLRDIDRTRASFAARGGVQRQGRQRLEVPLFRGPPAQGSSARSTGPARAPLLCRCRLRLRIRGRGGGSERARHWERC